MRHRLSAVIPILLLSLTSCGDNRGSTVSTSGGATASAKPAAESLRGALHQYLDRLRTTVTNTATRIQAQHPDNKVRRVCLLWQVQTNEVCLDIAYRRNLMVGLVQTWYWTVAMERFLIVGEGQALFGGHQEMACASATILRQECESLAARFIDEKPYADLKADIESSAGKGELFTATSQKRNDTMERFLSATRIESLFHIVLSPFDALSGVGKGADSLEELTRIADRAAVLAERYPQLISLHLQMAAIEVQEQEAPAQAFADAHRLTLAGEQLGETLRGMPERLRREAQVLLEQSGPVQADARVTLDKIHEAGNALEKAATAIDQGIRSLDAFVARCTAPDPHPQPDAKPGPPFDIKDYATTAAAIESLAKELRLTITALDRTLTDPALKSNLAELVDGRLAVTRAESERLLERARGDADRLLAQTRLQADQLLAQACTDAQAISDHLALRLAQLLGLAAALVLAVAVLLRLIPRRGA